MGLGSPGRRRSLLWRVAAGAGADGAGAVCARGRGWHICGDGLPAGRKAAQGLSAAAKETWMMNEQRFPKGWDEQRVKRLIAELDARTDEEWIAADEAGVDGGGRPVGITVPETL